MGEERGRRWRRGYDAQAFFFLIFRFVLKGIEEMIDIEVGWRLGSLVGQDGGRYCGGGWGRYCGRG